MMKRFIFTLLSLSVFAVSGLWAQPAMRTIEIGQQVTTHILFASDLTYVDISTPENIAAKVVDASKNMLAIKARKEFDYQTTVSALEANGTMHTFYVRYNASPTQLLVDMRQNEVSYAGGGEVNTQVRPQQESGSGMLPSQVVSQQQGQQQGSRRGGSQKPARGQGSGNGQQQGSGSGVNVASSQTSNFGRGNAPTLEEVLNKDRNLFHVSDRSYRLEADCVNVYAYSDQIYVVLQLKNNSDIGYEAGDAQFTIENRKTTAKTLSTDKSVWPRSSFGTLSCPPGGETKIGYTIPKLTLQKNEVMRIYIYEKNGNRNLFLTLSDTDINYAVSPVGH